MKDVNGNRRRRSSCRVRRSAPALRSTWRGLETWHGRDGVTLADERARQQGTQTSTYTGAPVLDPTCERAVVKFRRATRLLIVGERHLRRMLASYSSYYNESRTHLALEKDAPLRRAIQRCGAIITTPILSGLHHRYVRI